MKIDKVHCLFEQSGTFKNVFKGFGYAAYDYDLKDDFKQTDFVVDLFQEIEKAYDGENSIFDDIGKGDFVFAFFPCTYFSKNNVWLLTCQANCMDKWNDVKRLEYSMDRMRYVCKAYDLFCKFVLVLINKNIRCVIENPYSKEHFLTRYFPMLPGIVDGNRSRMGDQFKKPTQYYFINCVPENNLIFGSDMCYYGELKEVNRCSVVERSMISSKYAENFIKSFILDIDNGL